jgi:hypothetical protein
MAAAMFRDSREHRTFPSIAECKRACAEVPRSVVHAQTRSPFSTQAERSAEERQEDERRRRARVICHCEMGRQADREGWLVALIEFAADNGRLPVGSELDGVRKKARKSEDGLYANRHLFVKGVADESQPGPYYACLLNFRKTMLERAHQEVFGSYQQVEADDRRAWSRETTDARDAAE